MTFRVGLAPETSLPFPEHTQTFYKCWIRITRYKSYLLCIPLLSFTFGIRFPPLAAWVLLTLHHMEKELPPLEFPPPEQLWITKLEGLVENPWSKLQSTSSQVYTLRQELAASNHNLCSAHEGQRPVLRQLHLLRFHPKEAELAIPREAKIIGEVPFPPRT